MSDGDRDRSSSTAKREVHDFWNDAACGEILYLPTWDAAGYREHSRIRYHLEPYIQGLADFASAQGKRTLEIGVGLGADHERFAAAGAELYGIDLTSRAVTHTRRRLETFGFEPRLSVSDAENLPFPNESFDIVYSWGVLHHSPDTAKAVAEVWRVLRPGGQARVMVYQKWSLVGLMLWSRYALLRLKPWLSLSEIYSRHLESPGTKTYTTREAHALFGTFTETRVWTQMTQGDLLLAGAGQRHTGPLLTFARRLWPRGIIQRVAPGLGLALLVLAKK